jgi:hypothetical protein
VDRSLLGTNLKRLFKFKIKSHLIDKSELNYQSVVTLKHWHELPLVENQIMPTNSVGGFQVSREGEKGEQKGISKGKKKQGECAMYI